jgi:hypothetical protein
VSPPTLFTREWALNGSGIRWRRNGAGAGYALQSWPRPLQALHVTIYSTIVTFREFPLLAFQGSRRLGADAVLGYSIYRDSGLLGFDWRCGRVQDESTRCASLSLRRMLQGIRRLTFHAADSMARHLGPHPQLPPRLLRTRLFQFTTSTVDGASVDDLVFGGVFRCGVCHLCCSRVLQCVFFYFSLFLHPSLCPSLLSSSRAYMKTRRERVS